MIGHRKTAAMVSEVKKHYKLSKLKSFLDYEADKARGGPGQQKLQQPNSPALDVSQKAGT